MAAPDLQLGPHYTETSAMAGVVQSLLEKASHLLGEEQALEEARKRKRHKEVAAVTKSH